MGSRPCKADQSIILSSKWANSTLVNRMVDYQTFSVVLTGLSVSLAAIYYALTLRRQQETRNAQFFLQLYQNAQDQGFLQTISETIWLQDVKDFDDWWGKYGPENNMEFFKRLFSMMVFFEGVGILMKRKLIDPTIVDDMMSGTILLAWEKYELINRGIRERYSYPQWQEWQEYLTVEISKIVDKQHPDFRK